MEEEFDIKELFDYINEHDGEFFIRVTLNEEGELCGETDGCCLSETC